MTENLHLLTGGCVADALDPAERAAFEAHLAGCADCQAELRELAATAARLGGAEAVVPPAAMRVAVLAEVARTAQEPSDELSHRRHAATGPAASAQADEPGAAGDRTSRRTTWWAVAAAVVAVVALVLGGLLVQVRSDRAAMADRQQQLAAVLTADDAHAVAGSVSSGGRALVVVSDSRGEAAFVGTNLAPPPAGHTYQLWFIAPDGTATSAGVFDPNAGGGAAVLLEGSPSGAATVGLTVEPDGGSRQPTTQPVLAVSVLP